MNHLCFMRVILKILHESLKESPHEIHRIFIKEAGNALIFLNYSSACLWPLARGLVKIDLGQRNDVYFSSSGQLNSLQSSIVWACC